MLLWSLDVVYTILIWIIIFSDVRRKSIRPLVDTDITSGERNKETTAQEENVSALVGACDPDDRLRATEGGFLMTDMADVESIAEPSNNGKVVSA